GVDPQYDIKGVNDMAKVFEEN
ncbi:MAG: hypothetical protein RLZZ350_261, partial [Verrucomicrobiota bacterium]